MLRYRERSARNKALLNCDKIRRPTVPKHQRGAEYCGQDKANEERLYCDSSETLYNEQGELDVAHTERRRPEQTQDEDEHDNCEPAEELHVHAVHEQ